MKHEAKKSLKNQIFKTIMFKVSNFKTNKKGFSLFEFLIVIAIFSIMAIFTSTNLFNVSQTKNLENDVQKIVFILRSARDRSVERENSTRWGVHFENSTSSHDYFVLFSGADYLTGTSTIRTELKSGNEFVYPASGASTDIIFSEVYGLPSTTSSIIIALKDNISASSTIQILQQGQIQY